MMIGNRTFLFIVAFIIASMFFIFMELACMLLNCDIDKSVTFALTIIVIYWRLLDIGDYCAKEVQNDEEGNSEVAP